MAKQVKLDKYLPMSETTYYILLALVEPLHGYAVMQKVDEISGGVVKIGPGTLYGAFSTLEGQGLIQMIRQERRRKSYALTEKGRRALRAQIERLELMTENGRQVADLLYEKGS